MGRPASARRPIAFLSRLAMSLALAACAALGGSRPLPPPAVRDVLTQEEILSSNAHQGDLLQAIRSLRPKFLATPRGVVNEKSAAAQAIAIFVNGLRQTGVEALRTISAAAVTEVRYLDPTASQNIYGPRAGGGALVITLDTKVRPL